MADFKGKVMVTNIGFLHQPGPELSAAEAGRAVTCSPIEEEGGKVWATQGASGVVLPLRDAAAFEVGGIYELSAVRVG